MGRIDDPEFSDKAILGAATDRGLILEETHPCGEIVINIWQCTPAPALLFRKIGYVAAKIAHLRALFLEERKLDVRQVFNVYFGKMVFFNFFSPVSFITDNSKVSCPHFLQFDPASNPSSKLQDSLSHALQILVRTLQHCALICNRKNRG